MVSIDIFLLGLMIVSTLSSLVTEAVKIILVEHSIKYHANTLVGIIAAIISVALGIGYIILSGTAFTAGVVVCILALMFVSWLCAMVGYDKVISQFKNINKG